MGALLTEFSVHFYATRDDDHLFVVLGLVVGDRTVLLCYEQEVNTLHCRQAFQALSMPVH